MPQMSHEFLDKENVFQLQKWRDYVASRISEVFPRGSSLCPFGFEMTRDPSYLARDLRRYYVYLSLPGGTGLRPEVGGRIFLHLLDGLRRDAPRFYSEIGHVVRPGMRSPLNPEGSFLLQFQALGDHSSMLEMYSRYILACPAAILNRSLRESVDFDSRESARRYLFQLTFMLACIYPDVSPPTRSGLAQLMDAIARMAQNPATHESVVASAGREELRILAEVVIPFMERVQKYSLAPSVSGDNLKFKAVDIHSGRPLVGRMRAPVFAEKVALIELLYTAYPGIVDMGRVTA